MPETIVSGWVLFGVGLLSVAKVIPDRPVMSSKRMLLPLSACAPITIVTARATSAAIDRTIERKNRIIVEAEFSMACLEICLSSLCGIGQRFQALELGSLARGLAVPSCLRQSLGKRKVRVGAAGSQLNCRAQLLQRSISLSEGQPYPAACYLRDEVRRRQGDHLFRILQPRFVLTSAEQCQSELNPRRLVRGGDSHFAGRSGNSQTATSA